MVSGSFQRVHNERRSFGYQTGLVSIVVGRKYFGSGRPNVIWVCLIPARYVLIV